MRPRTASALDAMVFLIGAAAAALWSLTPYPRSEEQIVWVLWGGAVAALSLAFAAWRRWGWTDEGWTASRSVGGLAAVFAVAAGFVPVEGVIWRLPWHLATLVVAGMVAYSTLSIGRDLLIRLSGRA